MKLLVELVLPLSCGASVVLLNMPRSESGQTDIMALGDKCTEVVLPDAYKVKVCKFCRTASWQKTPLPLGLYPAWDPLVPWHQGRRDRPTGVVCRICSSVL